MGRPEFENQTLISAVTSKEIKSVVVSNTFALPHLSYDVTKLYSPKGTVSRVMGLEVYFPATGTNLVTEKNLIISLLEYTDQTETALYSIVEQLSFSADDNKDAKIEYGLPTNVRTYAPNSLDAFHTQLRGMIFDDEKPLQFAFYNNTGSTINTKREFTIFVEREVIKR
jgi:hypothetical protein